MEIRVQRNENENQLVLIKYNRLNVQKQFSKVFSLSFHRILHFFFIATERLSSSLYEASK